MRLSSPRGLAAATVIALATLSAGGAAAQSVPGVDNVNWGRGNVSYTADALRAYNDLTARWSAAWKDGDAKRVSDLYSVGAAVSYSGGELVRGREAVLQLLTQRLARGEDVRVAVTDFVSSGDIMSATGPFVIESENGALVSGTYAMTLRLEGGRWRIRSQVFTPSLPFGAPQAAAAGTAAPDSAASADSAAAPGR
jgi:ketosteroid isomerase-like protein